MWRNALLSVLWCLLLLCSFCQPAMPSGAIPAPENYSISVSDMNRLLVIWQELERLNSALQSKLQALQNDLNLSLQEQEQLKRELSQLRSELDTLKRELAALRLHLENSLQESAALMAQLQKSEDYLASLEQSFNAYKEQAEARIKKLTWQRNIAIAVAAVLAILYLTK